MNIKEKLETKEYVFLRRNNILKDNIILLTTGGSHAYGTNVETSDIDIRGIYINSAYEILIMNCADKPFEDKETDTIIYPLKQIVELLIKCNPNTIEILGTKEEHLFILSEEGKLLRDNVDLFLSQQAGRSFGGYATAQLRRLQNALARDSYPQKEKENHICNSIKNQISHFKDTYKSFTGQGIDVYIDKSEKVDYEEEIFMNIDLKHYPMRDFKGIYSEMINVINDYSKINHRNNKKDELHLNKHALHLIRLLIMGAEILMGKGVKTYRDKEREELLKIRNGLYNYSQIFEIVDVYENEFNYAKKNTNLPEYPDYNKINDLVININKKVINKWK